MNRIAGGQKGDYAPLLHREKRMIPPFRVAVPSTSLVPVPTVSTVSTVPHVRGGPARWARARPSQVAPAAGHRSRVAGRPRLVDMYARSLLDCSINLATRALPISWEVWHGHGFM